MLFIFDTNTLISAILIPDSIPKQALLLAQNKGLLVFSTETKTEILEVIQRAKFGKYLGAEERIKSASLILNQSKILETKSTIEIGCRDAKDIKFLLLALAADVTCLVSGDKDLTVLHPFHHIPILNPADFIRWMAENDVAA